MIAPPIMPVAKIGTYEPVMTAVGRLISRLTTMPLTTPDTGSEIYGMRKPIVNRCINAPAIAAVLFSNSSGIMRSESNRPKTTP